MCSISQHLLQYVGVDPLQAGNVVQLVLVLGLTIGWISTYIFRVSNKEMTYAQQLRDYENKVMEVHCLSSFFKLGCLSLEARFPSAILDFLLAYMPLEVKISNLFVFFFWTRFSYM